MTGFVLKMIAIITMFIDHAGFVLCDNNMTMRTIGRIAFPIFCFLIAEGADKTSNWKKYAIRLLGFAIISEPIADYAFYHSFAYPYYQNVYWTLLLGLLGIQGLKLLDVQDIINEWRRAVLGLVIVIVCLVLGDLCSTDYGTFGVLLICAIYQVNHLKFITDVRYKYFPAAIVAALFCFLYGGAEMFGSMAAICIVFYNGKRGWDHPVIKYGFYAFYPVHLLLLALLRSFAIG